MNTIKNIKQYLNEWMEKISWKKSFFLNINSTSCLNHKELFNELATLFYILY